MNGRSLKGLKEKLDMFANMILAIKKMGKSFLGSKKIAVTFHGNTDREQIILLANSVYKETETGLSFNELIQLYFLVESVSAVVGDLAEVGVYCGGSARIICQAKLDKPLHLFDTFDGLPEVQNVDKPNFFRGQYKADFERTVEYLKDFNNVHFYKGIFPETATPIKDKNFSLVHLDVDTWHSTSKCLEFFYPRMSKGGAFLVHDYSVAEGVRKAVSDFFSDKPETVIRLAENQCLIVRS